mgnify:CR=1 FL=1
MGIFDKFKIGFQKSASALTSGLKEIIIKKEIDDENLNKIEEFLIQSDVGVEAASEIKEIISNQKIDPNKDLTSEINHILKEYIISLMKPLENNSFFEKKEKLNATLVSGVNGVGKTTTIGKIGKILKTNGNKVMFAASDTFRAAAIEQLEKKPMSIAERAGKLKNFVFEHDADFDRDNKTIKAIKSLQKDQAFNFLDKAVSNKTRKAVNFMMFAEQHKMEEKLENDFKNIKIVLVFDNI